MESAEEGDPAEEFVHGCGPAMMMNNARTKQDAEVDGLGPDGEGGPFRDVGVHQVADAVDGVEDAGDNDGFLWFEPVRWSNACFRNQHEIQKNSRR